jgi:outer membrane biosynthesis protein TonB
MANTYQNMLDKKNIIVEILKKNGPSLPSSISSHVGLSLLFTSALLSELVADKAVRYSHLKVGGSPLYFISGQEAQLDNFTKHLAQKEKEAFQFLKEKGVVSEEIAEPGFRVAFRNMKDYAVPIKIKTGDDEKVFWRLHTVAEEDAMKKIEDVIKKLKPDKSKVEVKEEKKIEAKEEKKEETDEIKIVEHDIKDRKPREKKKEKGAFRDKVELWLDEKKLKLIEKFNDKTDNIGIISTYSNLGELNFIVIAKDKAKISESDLSLAYQQGLQHKVPVLLLVSGEITKKAKVYMEGLGKYIVVHQIV